MEHATPAPPGPHPPPDGAPQRDAYHHGDLRAALVAAGYELARSGGVAAVGVREATRRVGVNARAAYRHFANREALITAAALPALAALARVIETRREHLTAAAGDDPAQRALAALQGVGEGYIAYALDEPGGFDIAFFGLATMATAEDPAAAGEQGRTAYQLLYDALGGLVGAGLLSPSRVPVAAIACWSAAHGFATLAVRGPLRGLPRAELDDMARNLLAMTISGCVEAPPRSPAPT